LDQDVRQLELKNKRLREILSQIGVSTVGVSTGQVKTQEFNEVEHYKHLERITLDNQTKEE
jgi:hypothetical protein